MSAPERWTDAAPGEDFFDVSNDGSYMTVSGGMLNDHKLPGRIQSTVLFGVMKKQYAEIERVAKHAPPGTEKLHQGMARTRGLVSTYP